MNISLDLILPPVILGILITMIVSANILMMESSIENQSTHHLQATANNAVLIIQEEIKYLKRIESANGSLLEFVEKISDASDSVDVQIFKEDEYLKVIRTPQGGASNTQNYFLRLDDLIFEETVHGTTSAPFLRVTVISISSTSQQVNAETRYRASAERSIYLKNLHASGIFNEIGS